MSVPEAKCDLQYIIAIGYKAYIWKNFELILFLKHNRKLLPAAWHFEFVELYFVPVEKQSASEVQESEPADCYSVSQVALIVSSVLASLPAV